MVYTIHSKDVARIVLPTPPFLSMEKLQPLIKFEKNPKPLSHDVDQNTVQYVHMDTNTKNTIQIQKH